LERFRIEVADEVLADLRERLERTRFPDQIEAAGWDYGTELSYLKELCAYWRERFDWRAQEAALNHYDQFKTTIDGQSLHFIHARSAHPDALPLIITHGWPGSVYEFVKIIGPLTDPSAHGGDPADAFHVICPSMPGYGFSGPTHERGWDIQRVAEAEIALMKRLGYQRYGAQGGDWGALVTTQIGRLDPDHCCGIHLNMPMALPPPGEDPRQGLSDREKKNLDDTEFFQAQETGYQRIQATKPQTLGYGLNDSPAGLAAWIVEKFRTWSDCDGDVERVFTKDELLTNITIYWVTATINSSVRLYYEAMRSGRVGFTQGRVEVPTGCIIFPKELYKPPRKWVERHYNVTRWTECEIGGHFAALEQPVQLVEDLRAFYRELR
jgi:microsomal epoxide hydrolase